MKQKNLILMVVAVGCGLVAAFLTSQMSGRSAQVEQVEVIVAAKDLPVGTMLGKDDLKTLVKTKKLPKDGLPAAFVVDGNDLAGKRLSRAVRVDETFNPGDLVTGGYITLPTGMNMVSMQVSLAQAASGFVGPGARVDILATVRLQNRTLAFPLLVNMLVVAVDNNVAYSKDGTFANLNTVSFAVDRRQALLLELAKSRGCTTSLMLRHPEDKTEDEKYKIDDVLKMLQDEGGGGTVGIGGPGNQPQDDATHVKNPPPPKAPPAGTPKPPEPPKVETVKILVANKDFPAGTQITKDMAADMKLIEVPKGVADDAFGELTDKLEGKVLKFGLARGQWITGTLVGDPELKPTPERFQFSLPKDEPKADAPIVAEGPKRNVHDVIVHSASGSKVFRYEEHKPGEWRLVGEVDTTGRDAASRAEKQPEKQPEKRID